MKRPQNEFDAGYCGPRRRFSLFFRWYDLWVGAYWDKEARVLYICPLPTVGLRIAFEHPATVRRFLKRLNSHKAPDTRALRAHHPNDAQ